MRRALVLLTALALGAAPIGAGATTVPTLTLTQQARKADVIVRATLGTSTSVKEGEVTWLVYPLTVTETVAGDPASLPQREGKPVLYLLSGVEGLPELRSGQEAFLLLYNRRLDSPIVGFWQGVYPIENGKVTKPTSTLAPTLTPPVAAAQPTETAVGTATTGTAPGTTTASPAGSTPGTTPPATGTTPPSSGTGTPTTPPSFPAATTTTPGAATPAPTSTPGTASSPAPVDPNPIETDPTKFRDALRAARGAR